MEPLDLHFQTPLGRRKGISISLLCRIYFYAVFSKARLHKTDGLIKAIFFFFGKEKTTPWSHFSIQMSMEKRFNEMFARRDLQKKLRRLYKYLLNKYPVCDQTSNTLYQTTSELFAKIRIPRKSLSPR